MRMRTCRHRKEHVIQSWRRKFTLIQSKLACAHFATIVERRSEAQALVLILAGSKNILVSELGRGMSRRVYCTEAAARILTRIQICVAVEVDTVLDCIGSKAVSVRADRGLDISEVVRHHSV
jgi:hypothetical protein